MEPELLTYDLGEGVRAFSTKRKGGYSEGPYASFNANAYCGDDCCKVRLNRELLCRCLGLELPRLIMPRQVHGACVRRIGEGFFGLTDEAKAAALEGVDAVMTDLPRTCVSVSTADCIPILLYDHVHRIIAAVHAGWRGTVNFLVLRTLRRMHEYYGTEAFDVLACIGPGISWEAFEVGDEVFDAFHKAGYPMHAIATYDPCAKKHHIDLPEANAIQMKYFGMHEDFIGDCRICTYRRHEDFFSARRLGAKSGRILSGIMLQG